MSEQNRPPQRWTVKTILEWTTAYFKEKGLATPRLDAEVLLGESLSMNRLSLYLNLDRPMRPDERSRYRELVRRRANREPVALITGKKEFWSLELQVVPGVLVPRPDTEILVEAVLTQIRDIPAPRVLDVGTGTGAVAAAVAHDRPEAFVVATDVDPVSAFTARRNAERLGLETRVTIIVCDLMKAIRPDCGFDVVCSNPPYIPTKEIPTLQQEIARFEPIRALNGGPDGLEVIRNLIRHGSRYVRPGGALILEFGDGQHDAVRRLFEDQGITTDVSFFRDLAGKPRVIAGRLS